jgi:hypothetical protein
MGSLEGSPSIGKRAKNEFRNERLLPDCLRKHIRALLDHSTASSTPSSGSARVRCLVADVQSRDSTLACLAYGFSLGWWAGGYRKREPLHHGCRPDDQTRTTTGEIAWPA